MGFPKKVTLVEVGLRDGLQNEMRSISVDQKILLLDAIVSSGIKAVEVGSFVRADRVPQMADTGELFQKICRKQYSDEMEFRALIPNYRGLENAINSGAKHVKIGVSASRVHNLRNYNRTPEESIAAFDSVFELAQAKGIKVIGTVQMAFGSPWEGTTSIKDVISIVQIYDRYGISRIGLGDTSSMASPEQVYRMCSELGECFPHIHFKTHFHNARGLGLCNVMAAMKAGVTEFDASFAGLGGCPFVPGAAGNIATEDILNLFNELGIETGVEIAQTIEIGKQVEQIVGHRGNSFVLCANTSEYLQQQMKRQ